MNAVRQLGYENFDQFAVEGGLVAFTSTHCAPCRAMKPALAAYAEKGYNVATVDLDESPDIFVAFNISSLPTVLALKDGQIVSNRVGGAKLKDLEEMAYFAEVLTKKAA